MTQADRRGEDPGADTDGARVTVNDTGNASSTAGARAITGYLGPVPEAGAAGDVQISGTGTATASEGGTAISGYIHHLSIGPGGTIITGHLPAQIDPALSGLPSASPTFTGREDDVQRLLGLLGPHRGHEQVMVASIVGLAGVGKTELALQTAQRALREPEWFPGGVLFRNLHGYDPDRRVAPDAALDSLLRALGIPSEHIPGDLDGRAALYRSVLSAYARHNRRILVILDNAATVEQVQLLIPSDGSTALLITSRHNLAVGKRVELNVLAPEAAVDLMRNSLQQVHDASDARFDQDPHEALQIARLCGFLPLALQIAAALLADAPSRPLASLSQSLSDVHHRLDQLTREDRAVRAALDLSYANLSQAQARMFRLLALNPGPDLSTETAAHLADAHPLRTQQLLQDLARAHLVELGAIWGRWRLHDLVRLYASECAAKEPTKAEDVRRLLTYYLERVTRANEYVLDLAEPAPSGFHDRPEALAWLDAERDNLLAAADLAETTGHTEIAHALPMALEDYLSTHDYQEEWRASAVLAIRAAHSLGDKRAEARAGVSLSDALRALNAPAVAIAVARKAAEIFRSQGDQPGEGMALRALASALGDAGRHEESVRMSEKAIPLLQHGPNRHIAAVALMDYGVHLIDAERYSEATDTLREALAVLSQTSRSVESLALRNLAGALDGVGRRGEAIGTLQQALARAPEEGGRWDTINAAEASFFLGTLLEEDEQHPQASQAFQQAAELSEKAGNGSRAAQALTALAASLMAQERHEEAADALHAAVTLTRRATEATGDAFGPEVAELLMILSTPLVKLRRFDDAVSSLREALAILRRLTAEDPHTHESGLAPTLEVLSRVLSQDDDQLPATLEAEAEAVEINASIVRFHYLRATRQSRLGPDHPDTLRARHNLASFRGEAGDPAGAAAAFMALLADRERALGPDHPHTLATRGELEYWCSEAGDQAGAITGFTQLLADQERVLGSDHPDTLITRYNLAWCRGEAGDPTGAITGFAQLLADQERVLGPDHLDTLITRHNLAWCRGEAGDPTGAITGFTQLLADQERVLGPDHPHTLEARHHLAHWQQRAEREDEHGAT
ncbi:tetratricopeptide repeat protein [Streptomyces sp. NPDC093591]|uniref:tetratricopeptide repeat protein n=1 Tax=Streptomyces sp. NPDC093591 TaxID=3366044 RepID=UPI00382496B8